MGRSTNRDLGIKGARAGHRLHRSFTTLMDAARRWADGKANLEDLDIALDGIDTTVIDDQAIDPEMTREEKLKVLAERYAAAAQVRKRMATAHATVRARESELKKWLLATLAEPPAIPAYAVTFIHRLQAEGIGQPDLHPASRKLAKAVAETIRRHNDDRRREAALDDEADELYPDTPISTWAELGDELHGLRIEFVLPGDGHSAVHDLPPSTRIAWFTDDGVDPKLGDSFMEDLICYHEVIQKWMFRRQESDSDRAELWAFLLSHHLVYDGTDLKQLAGRTFRSPWRSGDVVELVAES